MQTILDSEDVEKIALRVVELIKPLLSVKEEGEDVIFSVDELAEYLRTNVKWVYNHVWQLPHFKLDGLLRFRKSEIDKVIDKLSLQKKINSEAAGAHQISS